MSRLKGTALRKKIRRIRLLVSDVDGVLTDGKMIYGPDGGELKNFNVKDGTGIRLLQRAGVRVAWITGENSPAVRFRARKLDIEDLYAGTDEKVKALDDLLALRGLSYGDVAYIGDDLTDIPPMQHVALAVAVADAVPEVLKVAHYVTRRKGGEGAVRELCDLILAAR